MLNLGWENNWELTPQIVKDCVALEHVTEKECLNANGTYHKVTCKLCDYYYTVDSSD